MIDTSTSPLRRAMVAAILSTSTLSAGCYRTIVVPTSELPRLVAAQAEGAPELQVIDVDGERETIPTPVDEITLVPVDPDQTFMQPPGGDWAVPVPEPEHDALFRYPGWREAG